MVLAMIVCDGLAGRGCPRGSVLEVELVDRAGPAARDQAREVLEPHGWCCVLPLPGEPPRPEGAFDPLCPGCRAELEERARHRFQGDQGCSADPDVCDRCDGVSCARAVATLPQDDFNGGGAPPARGGEP
jgi:hypothetical protein